MDETTLIGRLGSLDPPGMELAKGSALESVPARVRAARSGPTREGRLWPRLVAGSAFGLVVLVSFSVLTAPGQAFTGWVGDRLGLGEPGGPPALQSLHQNAMRGTVGQGAPAYVLLRGPASFGEYEFITFEMTSPSGRDLPGDGTRCFQLEFPEAGNLFHAGCGVPSASNALLYEGVGGNSAPGASYQFASGRVSEEVVAVDFEVDGQPFPVELRPISADLIERLELPRPFKFFVVFLDGDLREGEVAVTARDAAGNAAATRTESLLGAPVIQP